MEKRNHSHRLTALKDVQESELAEMEECHAKQLHDMEAEHEFDVVKLKSEFKAELMKQKTELENKLTEFRIEYEQKMDSLGQDEEEGEEEEKECEKESEVIVERSPERNKEKSPMSDENFIGKRKIIDTVQDEASSSEGVTRGKERLQNEEKKYDEILKELKERRKMLENDLEELKSQENKVNELKNSHLVKSHSHCSKTMCVHENKYNKMKAKYSGLVNRIKSQKAKRSSRPSPAIQNTVSLSSDKCSMESNPSVCDSGQPSTDPSLSSTSSSPNYGMLPKTHLYHSTTSDASEDEEVKYATKVLEKYRNFACERNTYRHTDHHIHQISIPFSSTLKQAWEEDELLVHGKKELNKAEKLLRSLSLKNCKEMRDISPEDVHKKIIQQNMNYRILKPKVTYYHFMFKCSLYIFILRIFMHILYFR